MTEALVPTLPTPFHFISHYIAYGSRLCGGLCGVRCAAQHPHQPAQPPQPVHTLTKKGYRSKNQTIPRYPAPYRAIVPYIDYEGYINLHGMVDRRRCPCLGTPSPPYLSTSTNTNTPTQIPPPPTSPNRTLVPHPANGNSSTNNTRAHLIPHIPHSLFTKPPIRLHAYRQSMRFKAGLRLVCRSWAGIAQEVLYEFVWVSRGVQARRLASVLDAYIAFSRTEAAREEGDEECPPDHVQVHTTGVLGFRKAERSPGRFIRRLHIETPVLERCSPSDLRIILDHAPLLQIYSDYRSIRRLSPQDHDPRLSPEQLLGALVHPGNSLRRLSWTNYEYDGGDYIGGVSFYRRVVNPMLGSYAEHLEFLELNFCSRDVHSSSYSLLNMPKERDTLDENCNLTLPKLKSLKVTLDNATFAVLGTWHMPLLTNLSVLSSDYSYLSTGFSTFFHTHGAKLTQLELGHSSSSIEEHYLTNRGGSTSGGVPLAEWCPNLKEFVCSADAEWNWQSPDWISPHVLLPSHPGVELIGIRDMDKRGGEEGGGGEEFFMLEEQIVSLLRSEAFPSLRYVRDLSPSSDLIRRTGVVYATPSASSQYFSAYPPLPPSVSTPTFLSRFSAFTIDSKAKAKGGKEAKRKEREEKERERGRGRAVLRFWEGVLGMCRERGVWLEDWRGVNVTLGDLRRAESGVCVPGIMGV
ncbi:hypothetical protein BDQ17DRAFT_1509365 [Cyathus striatus]|nr:hypothetical protein BDQ17DRAFT_1509365 [Cyathus striatus]